MPTQLKDIQIGGKTIKVNPLIADRLVAANDEFKKATGSDLKINSAYRSAEQQAGIFKTLSAKGARVAPAGKSFHQSGDAVDVSNWKEAEPYLRKFMLKNELSDDKGHFSVGETSKMQYSNMADQVIAARKKGKSDTEILAKLTQVLPAFQGPVEQARKQGKNDSEIINRMALVYSGVGRLPIASNPDKTQQKVDIVEKRQPGMTFVEGQGVVPKPQQPQVEQKPQGILGQMWGGVKKMATAPLSQEFWKPSEKGDVRIRDVVREAGSLLTTSEQGLAETYSSAIMAQTKDYDRYLQSFNQLSVDNQKLANAIIKNKQTGKDSSRLEKQLKSNLQGSEMKVEDIIPAINKTVEQVAGESLGTFLDIASAGEYGAATKGAESFKLLKPVAKGAEIMPKIAKPLSATKAFFQGAKPMAKTGAIFGGGYSASQAMQENKSFGDTIIDTVKGTVAGGLFSAVLGGFDKMSKYQAGEKAAVVRQDAIDQYRRGIKVTKERYAEMQDKIIPQLLDEGTWGTFNNLMKKADDGIALSGEEYNKLGELQGIIEINGLTEKIDQKMKELTTKTGSVISVNQSRYNQLEKLKNDIIGFQDKAMIVSESGIYTKSALQQDLRELAQTYGADLYDTRKAQKTVEDSKTLSQVKRVDGMIRELLNTKNPEYAKINKLYSFSTNLKDVLLESDRIQKNSNLFNGIDMLKRLGSLLVGGATLTTTFGEKGLVGSMGIAALYEIYNSTWFNTLRAVQKNKLSQKLLEMSTKDISKYLVLLSRQGLKAVDEIIGSEKK